MARLSDHLTLEQIHELQRTYVDNVVRWVRPAEAQAGARIERLARLLFDPDTSKRPG